MATTSTRLSTFVWQGKDGRGNKQKGEISGVSVALVRAQLRKQGIKSASVKRKAKPLFAPSRQKIKPMDIAVFTRQMATMMKAGVPLLPGYHGSEQSIDALYEQALQLGFPLLIKAVAGGGGRFVVTASAAGLLTMLGTFMTLHGRSDHGA